MVGSREVLSENLKRYRKKNALQQDTLAVKCGISTREYGKIERCQVNPSLQTLDKLIAGTGLTVAQLLAEDFFAEDENDEEK